MFKPACFWIAPLAVVLATATISARADVVTDANAKAAEIASKNPATPVAVRTMAIVQVSVYEATNAITKRYPASRMKVVAAPGASVDAAVAAATRIALLKLMPTQQAAIEAAYQEALRLIPDGGAKLSGIAVGEQAAVAVFRLVRGRPRRGAQYVPPLHNGRCLCADSVAGATALGQAPALGNDQRRSVSPGSAAQPDQRGVEAGLR
jgi:hypothetical protein